MKRWLSSFSPRYIRSLAYIMQASEYNVPDAFHWFRRVTNFHQVEIRKQLTLTPKSTAVIILGCIIEGSLLAVALWFVYVFHDPVRIIGGLALFALTPLIVAAALTASIGLFQLTLQPIITRLIVDQARRRLLKLPAIRIAIAGSYGKTSMREILRAALGAGRRVAAPGKSINTPIGVSRFIQSLTGHEEIIVFEIGEYRPGDVRQLARLIQPEFGFLTGANEAHLEKFRTIDRTVATIFELNEFVPADHLYINASDPRLRDRHTAGTINYQRDGAGEWAVSAARTNLAGTDLKLTHAGQTIDIHSQLLGLHHLGPLAAAAHLAARLRLTDDQIQRGLSATTPYDHRLQPLTDAHGVITLDDSYNGNPDGVKAVIDFLAGLKGHQRWYVTPGLVEMGDRTADIHRQIGLWLATAGIEHVMLIKNSVTPFINEGLQHGHYQGQTHWFDHGPLALNALPHLTVAGDVVLLQNDWPDQYA